MYHNKMQKYMSFFFMTLKCFKFDNSMVKQKKSVAHSLCAKFSFGFLKVIQFPFTP